MALDEISLSILAIAAGILILSGWVPQIIRGYRTKRLDDISKYLMTFVAIGAVLWAWYGFEKDDIFIIGVNVAAIALTMAVLAMKFRYEKRNNQSEKTNS
ncbi:MAG: putative MtN3 (Sweet) Family transporter [Nitrosopumilales archaeon]|nr:MAG: putative MtN3 (Sweet) Family transporter [Nitrosopumilales archaeon]